MKGNVKIEKARKRKKKVKKKKKEVEEKKKKVNHQNNNRTTSVFTVQNFQCEAKSKPEVFKNLAFWISEVGNIDGNKSRELWNFLFYTFRVNSICCCETCSTGIIYT